jgi:hypothetical protein
MIRQYRVFRAVATAAAAAGCLLLFACGSSNNTTTTGIVASFAADAPSPAANSVTLQPGGATGALFNVRVSAREIDDLFGAAFWISFDTTNVAYRTCDDSTSLLRDGGEQLLVDVNSTSSPGNVKVGISRIQNADGTVKGVNVTDSRDLIVLTFVARAAVTATPIAFVDGHELATNSGAPPGNVVAGVTWAGGTLTAK